MVLVTMGSQSDWEQMKHCSQTLSQLNIIHSCKITSAHRTHDRCVQIASQAERDGIEVIIAGAGGSASLPGLLASITHLPIIGVPMNSPLNGIDSLYSIGMLPSGTAVGCMPIGKTGAINAALFAASILSLKYTSIRDNLIKYRKEMTESVAEEPI